MTQTITVWIGVNSFPYMSWKVLYMKADMIFFVCKTLSEKQHLSGICGSCLLSVWCWTTIQPLCHSPYNCGVHNLRVLIFLPLWTLCDYSLTHRDLGAFLCQVCCVIGLESRQISKWTISSAQPELDKTRHISAVICVVLDLLLSSWTWHED